MRMTSYSKQNERLWGMEVPELYQIELQNVSENLLSPETQIEMLFLGSIPLLAHFNHDEKLGSSSY